MKKPMITLVAAIGLVAGTFAATVNLTLESGDTTLSNGDVAIGILRGNHKVSIADGATVTLRGVTINGMHDSDYRWAGITCLGDATIILEGANTVKGFYEDYPGIYVPTNKTLHIKGNGLLNASSNGCGAGIGGGYYGAYNDLDCGNIVIEGGVINATGGNGAAGIGSGYYGICGYISIEGGTINATGGGYAAGIGSGNDMGACGDITIFGGTVFATGGENAAGIGCGCNSSCGKITITMYVTSVTATKGEGADNSIGASGSGLCGTVTIGDVEGAKSESPYTFPTPASFVDLSEWSGDLVVADNTTLTGTLGGNYKVAIADGATVTISNVVINGVHDDNCHWAGITCLGDATIILEGANTVKGFYRFYPGIYVPWNNTLTIKGNGSLNASSNGLGAGIGGGCYGAQNDLDCGNIVIEGGVINATGGNGAAGIGSGYYGICGYISIEGGTINATGGGSAAGIGSGNDMASCGDITISGGTVVATGDESAAGIGSGANSGCRAITITKGVTSVTATKGDYADNSIGASGSGLCGTVTIGGVVTGNITESPYTYPTNLVNLSGLSGDYTAQDGDVLIGNTTYKVTVPSGVTVTLNGVEITGAGGGTVLPTPVFSANGKAATTEFTKGANGKWTLTAFAELGNDALGADVANRQIKVYRADTVEGLDSASPMANGVEVKGKRSAVMTTIEVTPPVGAQSQFFKVKFGE